jgi:AcrR family transcriptional regulator
MLAGVNMYSVTSSTRERDSYHHGDLHNALIQAAAGLAARGGPDAVTIRAAAREVGVTPTATYRHFTNQLDLLCAVKDLAFDGMYRAVERYLAEIPTDGDPVEIAVRRLEASGRGYVTYALAEPGLFRTAFCPTPADGGPESIQAGPYLLLSELLDNLVEVGHMDPERRPAAEASAWSAVHGLSLLLLDGPLRTLSPAERDDVIDRTVRMVWRGLGGGPRAQR